MIYNGGMTTLTDLTLTFIGWVGARLDRHKIRGAVRTGVQAWWATLFTQEWGLDLLDVLDVGGFHVTPVQATVFTMAVLWKAGDWLQTNSRVRSNAVARAVMVLVMGGGQSPKYKVAR